MSSIPGFTQLIKFKVIVSNGNRAFGGASSFFYRSDSCNSVDQGDYYPFVDIMVPNPRAIKALNAMKVLGISTEEVKPVLVELLRVYDRNWELIEEDNYRTLVDAYFEFKEDKVAPNTVKGIRGKKKAPFSCHDGERPRQKLRLIDEDDQTLSTKDNSIQKLSAEVKRMPPGIKPRTSTPASHTSLSVAGLSESSNGDRCVKSLSTPNQIIQRKDTSSSCNNNTRTRRGNIPIASSPLGEVKLSLNCDSALGQPNFCAPNLDAVMKFVEEKYLMPCRSIGPQPSMVKLLDGLCSSFLRMGHRKGSNSNYANSHMACQPQQSATQDKSNSSHFISDISKGSEKVKISLLDEIGSEDLPSKFNYIPHSIIYQSANVNISLARISDEGCCSDCSGNCLSLSLPCACARETGGEFAYTPKGLLKEEFLTACVSMKNEPQQHHFVYCQECPLEKSKNEYLPDRCKGHMVRKFIKECWRKCGCDMRCGNRVVQRGIRCKLQVFMTREGKGWGLRTLEDLPKGTFVCEYAGEILTNTELYERIMENSSGNDRHTYPVTLDADWGSEGVLKDEEALCLDATYNGNVGRFINHRCFDANLIDIPVEVETPDHHYYHLAFFTNKNVKAYEELTWDYGIDFDDHDHPIKAFQCCCGSAFCSNKKGKGKRKIENHVDLTIDMYQLGTN